MTPDNSGTVPKETGPVPDLTTPATAEIVPPDSSLPPASDTVNELVTLESSTHALSEEGRRKPPDPADLKENQELTIVGKLLDPTKFTFLESPERIRNHSKVLPEEFFRTFHEESKTLCAYMSEGNQPKHREAEGVKIAPENAFQSLGCPDLTTNLTLNRFGRHPSWGTTLHPSSWISTFDSLKWAIRRAKFHTVNSAKIGHRISIAGISTKDLVAATAYAPYETSYTVITGHGPGKPRTEEIVYTSVRHVAISVWIRQNAMPKDGSAITRQQLKASGADLWVSITELRISDLRDLPRGSSVYEGIMKKGHDYEWLCLGSIKKSLITRVMPWDGEVLHATEGTDIVWSKYSPEHYIYDWGIKQWRLDPELSVLAILRYRKIRLEQKLVKQKARKEAAAHQAEESASRISRKLKAKSAAKSTYQEAHKSKKGGKRKRNEDGDSEDESRMPSKVPRTNAGVWKMMMEACPRDECNGKKNRNTRADSVG